MSAVWTVLIAVGIFAAVSVGVPIIVYLTVKMARYGWLKANQSFKSQQRDEEE